MSANNKPVSDNHAKLLAIASAFAKFVDEADKASLELKPEHKEPPTCP
ncbi:MAG: hypothetical protein FWE20_07605 [Defluviitaleaceae bacterium]|nr:hypothetical protein [Defluviitaleaceae bacterium]